VVVRWLAGAADAGRRCLAPILQESAVGDIASISGGL
jgi:hypothetical protein